VKEDGMLADYIKALYDIGFTPIPINYGYKNPACRVRDYLAQRPDLDRILSDFDMAMAINGGVNIGLVCGKIHNLVVVDVDSHNNSLPQKYDTLKVLTRRGVHLHFYPPEEPVPTAHLEGLDILGEKAIAMIPPSVVFYEKKPYRYQWVEKKQMQKFPQEILEALSAKSLPSVKNPIKNKWDPDYPTLDKENFRINWSKNIVDLFAQLDRIYVPGNRHNFVDALVATLIKNGVPEEKIVYAVDVLTDIFGDEEKKYRIKHVYYLLDLSKKIELAGIGRLTIIMGTGQAYVFIKNLLSILRR
jgi:hypothetical protein